MNKQIHILYIDDNPLDRALVRDSLEKEHGGFILTEARSQHEFEKLFHKDGYDLVLTDFNILGFDGLQVLEMVKKVSPDTPVVFVTGTGTEEVAVEAMKRGASDYVIKTASHINRLPKTIQAVIGAKQVRLEKEKAQNDLLKMNRIYAVISQINQLIVRTNDRDKLFRETCDIAINFGGFRMAWIGLVDETSKIIKPHCWSGHEDGYLTKIELPATDSSKLSKGPGGKAILDENNVVCNDVGADPIMEPWRDEALKRGYHSIIALPIKFKKKVYGIFFIYSNDLNFFDKQETRLLIEVADDISFALESIQKEQARLKAESDLQKSEKELQKAQSIAHIGSWYLDLATNEVVWTEELYKMYGFDSMLPPPPYTEHKKLFTPESWDILSTSLAKTSETGISYELELKTVRKDGSSGWMWVRGESVLDNENNIIGLWGAAQDITDRKQAEEELREAKEKAVESDRLKTAFLHNISHEIRTPMNAIIGFSGFLNEPDLPPTNRKEFTDIIVRSSNQLLSIINDIVNIASIEAGQVKYKEQEMKLNALISLLESQFKQQSIEKNIPLTIKTTLPDEQAFVKTDETKLAEILSNLISNAFKFTKKGLIEVGYSLKEEFLEFYVKDSGIGIPDTMQNDIFERFRQVESTLARQYGGSGLGLSISKAYVELLGGKIWVTSELDKGSTFYFTVPYKKVTHMEQPFIKPVAELELDFGKNKTLLIAEDEDSNFMLLKALLSNAHINIIRAGNGAEAVAMCRLNPSIDLVLMDIKMPVMDGYDATKQIKEFLPELPVIAQTAYITESDKNKAIASGCCDFISKPIERASLISKIKQHLGN